MIVEPDLLSHPKFIGLKSVLGDVAMEILIRLWAHCQQNKRGQVWGDVPPAYVEIVTTGGSAKGRVYEALMELGWICRTDAGVVVHDWEAHNGGLLSAWNARAKWKASRDKSQDRSPDLSSDPSHDTIGGPIARPIAGAVDRTGHDTTRCTEERRRGGEGLSAEPSASDVARSKAQFAALKAVVAETESRLQDLDAEQRSAHRKNKAALKALQERQARGEF